MIYFALYNIKSSATSVYNKISDRLILIEKLRKLNDRWSSQMNIVLIEE